MNKEITKEDIQFMYDEIGLTPDDINAMNEEEYRDLFIRVLEIEGDENVKCDGKPMSERGKRATAILEKMYE
jgi:hypothetical protein